MGNYLITQYGADCNGKLCTREIQAALDDCRENGGTVVVPPGVYLTGPLTLYSDTCLYLEAGAVLKGSEDPGDYLPFPYVHNEFGPVRSLFFARNEKNITITGYGTIDFSGNAFFDFNRSRNVKNGSEEYSREQLEEMEAVVRERPNQMIFLRECENIVIQNIQLKDAACWGIVCSLCEGIRIADVRIRFGMRIPNADGIHLCSCKNVRIHNCDIVSGDDCIAITGIDQWDMPSENIIISGCLLKSASSGIRIGYWQSRVEKVQVSHCIIQDSGRGICMMGCKGGKVNNVYIDHLIIKVRSRAGGWWGRGEAVYLNTCDHKVNSQYGMAQNDQEEDFKLENIFLDNILAEAETGILIAGGKNTMKNIYFKDVDITLNEPAAVSYHGWHLDLAPSSKVCRIPEQTAYWLYEEEKQNVLFENINIHDRLREGWKIEKYEKE